MTEDDMRAKLVLIAATLRRLENSAAHIGGVMSDTAYWQGRKEAIQDIRDKIGSLEEFETDAETTTMARPATPADCA